LILFTWPLASKIDIARVSVAVRVNTIRERMMFRRDISVFVFGFSPAVIRRLPHSGTRFPDRASSIFPMKNPENPRKNFLIRRKKIPRFLPPEAEGIAQPVFLFPTLPSAILVRP